MQDDWVSISDYARKFNLSDITVRRRIKQGRINAELKNGKYYIRNIPMQLSPPPVQEATDYIQPFTPVATPVSPTLSVTSAPAISTDLTVFCDKYLAELKSKELLLVKKYEAELETYRIKIAKNENEIISLKQQIEDLQLLVKILEKR